MRGMEKNEIVRSFFERGILLDPDAIDDLTQISNAEISKLIESLSEMSVDVASEREIKLALQQEVEHPAPTLEIVREPVSSSSDSRPDYLKFFQGRYERVAALIRRNSRYSEVSSVLELKGGKGGPFVGVLMVAEKKQTRQGHLGLVMEDPTGRLKAVVPRGTRILDTARKLVADQVVGVVGDYDKEKKALIVRGLDLPQLDAQRGPLADSRIFATLISDLHFGSADFMDQAFSNFLAWTRGEFGAAEQRRLARSTGFISIAGDLVDGSGSKTKLYSKLSERLALIPDRMKILVIPGENDLSGVSDPQVSFGEEALKIFNTRGNLSAAGSPCRCRMNGISVLAYHGRSLVDWMDAMKTNDPCEAMQNMVSSRLFAPIYGRSVPVVPSTPDPFFISEVPRIVHMGHTHKGCHRLFKGTALISSGSWLESDLEKGAGKAFIVDLSSLKTEVIDFVR